MKHEDCYQIELIKEKLLDLLIVLYSHRCSGLLAGDCRTGVTGHKSGETPR